MIHYDLSGPAGNAHAVLGAARKWAEQLGWNWTRIRTRATASDYDNLIDVLQEEFKGLVLFEKPEPE